MNEDEQRSDRELLKAAVDAGAAAAVEASKVAEALKGASERLDVVEELRVRDRRIYMALLGTILLGVIALSSALGFSSHRAHHDRQDLAQSVTVVKRLADRIDDCVNAKGDCYKRQQARTNSIVGVPSGPINTVSLYIAACAQSNTGDDAILQCVQDKLAKRKG